MDIITYLAFAVGIVLIVKGGDFFVDAATWIAEVSGIPKFIVGATVVSFATTMPELLVSTIATSQGKVAMAVGNVVGSVVANTGLIMAVSILFMPAAIKRSQIMGKGLMMVLSISMLALLSRNGTLTLLSGAILFAIFIVFIIENLRSAKKEIGAHSDAPRDKKTVVTNILKFVFGAAGIIIGAQLLVDKGSIIARMIGIPESVIGLTAIALGTSLPELVTTLSSIIKKQSSMSVGNILGANIIVTTLVIPVCVAVSGGTLVVEPTTVSVDIPVALAIMAVVLIPTLISQKFKRWQGAGCLAIYIGYLAYMFI